MIQVFDLQRDSIRADIKKLTKDGRMARKAGVCCAAGVEAGAAAGDAVSWRTPAVPPHVQLPSAITRHSSVSMTCKKQLSVTPLVINVVSFYFVSKS